MPCCGPASQQTCQQPSVHQVPCTVCSEAFPHPRSAHTVKDCAQVLAWSRLQKRPTPGAGRRKDLRQQDTCQHVVHSPGKVRDPSLMQDSAAVSGRESSSRATSTCRWRYTYSCTCIYMGWDRAWGLGSCSTLTWWTASAPSAWWPAAGPAALGAGMMCGLRHTHLGLPDALLAQGHGRPAHLSLKALDCPVCDCTRVLLHAPLVQGRTERVLSAWRRQASSVLHRVRVVLRCLLVSGAATGRHASRTATMPSAPVSRPCLAPSPCRSKCLGQQPDLRHASAIRRLRPTLTSCCRTCP